MARRPISSSCEFKPSRHRTPNRASLSPTSATGSEFATLTWWSLLPSDTVSIRRAQDILGTELQAGGVGLLHDRFGDELRAALIAGLYHHLGTTRMHVDPRHGVVDPSCRVHGVPYLYATGGSVFPTSGAANPTLTIVALALRLADEVKRVLAAR